MNFILTHAPILIIAIPLLSAFLTALIGKFYERIGYVITFIAVMITGILTFYLAGDVISHGLRIYVLGAEKSTLAIPEHAISPIRIILEVDAFSMFVSMIIVSLTFISVIFSYRFIEKNWVDDSKYTQLDKYYTLILLLLAGMLGIVFTGDMFNLFVFLEITSIAGCALVVFYVNRGENAEAAFKYMVIGSLGALFVLFAVALFYGQYDALNIAYIAHNMNYTYLDKVALVLLIGAFAMKAGSVPLHMWKPDAYGEAPVTVSMILITSSLASLYALFRVCFTLYGGWVNISVVGWIIVLLGILSIFIGVTMALIQDKFTRLLGYTAVAEIGYMMLGVGVCLASGTVSGYGLKALEGGLFHLLNDALDLGLLFCVAGAIIYVTRKNKLSDLGGLGRNMKLTVLFFIIAFAAISGLPPMNGFASKLMIYETAYKLNPLLSIIAILSSIIMLGVFVKVFHSVFLGPSLKEYRSVTDPPVSMLIPMCILVVFIILIGIFPSFVVNAIVEPAANALINHQQYISAVVGGV